VLLLYAGAIAFERFQPAARVTSPKKLSYRESFDVDGIRVVRRSGYHVMSEVCEVSLPEEYLRDHPDLLNSTVFHAFRVARAGPETTVLFAQSGPATDGSQVPAFIASVNDAAVAIDDGGSSLRVAGATESAPGATEALSCASSAGPPPEPIINGFDAEAWRQVTINELGEQQINADGSVDDYVKFALIICGRPADADARGLQDSPGADTSGVLSPAFGRYVHETFCPRV
jgi:hypothetical protein